MSIINYYNSPTVINWNLDQNGQPVSLLIQNETKQVVDGKIPLEGLPDEQYRIQITGYVEINIKDIIDSPDKFKCDYTHGVLYFDQSKNGVSINIDRYYSRGQFYIPASRIWTRIDDFGEVVETLDDVISELEGALELSNEIQQAESIRISNENIRISSESERITNENKRELDETERNTNENIRKSNESMRITGENTRVSDENTRNSNEDTRIADENERKDAESIRKNDENIRISNENTRKSNEQDRQSNEAIRQSNEQDRQNSNNAFKVWENYDNVKDYVPLNKVQYQGSSYINKVACKGVLPTDTSYWQLVASKGQDGVGGDMYKSLYDTNNNGKVDIAENAEKLEGKTLAQIYDDIPEGTTVVGSTTNGNILVNNSEIQVYDDTSIQNSINNLAGIGRTTETVKDNSDKISILNTKVSPETPLDTTSQNLSGAVNEVKSDLTSHKAEYANQIANRIKKDGDAVTGKYLHKGDAFGSAGIIYLNSGNTTGGLIIKTNIPDINFFSCIFSIDFYASTTSNLGKLQIYLRKSGLGTLSFTNYKATSIDSYKPEIKIFFLDGKLALRIDANYPYVVMQIKLGGISNVNTTFLKEYLDSWSVIDGTVPTEAIGTVIVPYTT